MVKFKFQNILTGVIFITLLLVTDTFARSELEIIKKNISANVIFLRHALAPGVGDPENFMKEDCSTQRNLNDKGRLQARLIGNYLRSTNLKFSQILTSEWCRCIDTAKELDLGQWTTFSGLNSFFQEYEKKESAGLHCFVDFPEFALDFHLQMTNAQFQLFGVHAEVMMFLSERKK